MTSTKEPTHPAVDNRPNAIIIGLPPPSPSGIDPTGAMIAPSSIHNQMWLWAHSEADHQSPHREHTGCWEVYCPLSELDMWWSVISVATEAGHLGPSSRCGTAVPQVAHPYSPLRIIGIYTADCRQPADIARVLRRLRALGINWTVSYRVCDRDKVHSHRLLWVALDDSTLLQKPTVLGLAFDWRSAK